MGMSSVLLVEDSKALRALYSGALQSYDLNIFTASNPLEAMSILEHHSIDCILSDFEMPEMNGLDFCKKVKLDQRFKAIPFVILSIHDNDEKILQCIQAGADDYLIKRTNAEIISNKIKLMAELYRGRQVEQKTRDLMTYQATVATLNHEWNNLFVIIHSFLGRFEKSKFTEEEQKNFVALSQGINRIQRTINSFKDVTEVEFEEYVNGFDTKIIKLKNQ